MARKKMEIKSDADIMEDTRIYLEANGWWKGGILGPNGRQVCGLGALIYSQGWVDHRYAFGGPSIDPRHKDDVERILQKVVNVVAKYTKNVRMNGGSSDFTCWNDNIAKSKQEVLDAFAKAEKIERAGFDPDA